MLVRHQRTTPYRILASVIVLQSSWLLTCFQSVSICGTAACTTLHCHRAFSDLQQLQLRSRTMTSAKKVEVIELLSSDDEEGSVGRDLTTKRSIPAVTGTLTNKKSETAKKRRLAQATGAPRQAPIKLFATAQDLQERQRSGDPNHWSRSQCLTLREMIGYDGDLNGGASIEWMILSNFLVDLDFLLEEMPELLSVPRTIVFYGEADSSIAPWQTASQGRVSFRQLRPSDPPGSATNPLRMTMSYGVHHTKAFLVGLDNGTVRVIIHTSNLRREDMRMKAQAAFLQDFPSKCSSSPTASHFEEDLVSYFESYGFRDRVVWGSVGPSVPLSQCLKSYDFSAAEGVLIPSIPGYHSIQDCSVGHLKLRRAVAHHTHGTQRASAPVTCQFSSIGSLNEKYLVELQSSMDTRQQSSQSSPQQSRLVDTKPAAKPGASRPWDSKPKAKAVAPAKDTNPRTSFPLNLRLVYPTMEEIVSSLEGPGGGNTVPGRVKNLDAKPFLRALLHRWAPRAASSADCNPLWKPRNVPHLKTYFQLGADHESMQWLLVTSHNLSMAAWGNTIRPQFCRPESRLMIRSWELGVFVSPSLLRASRLVPWSPQREFLDGDVTVPLPYKLIPDPYVPSDVPWAVDRPMSAYQM